MHPLFYGRRGRKLKNRGICGREFLCVKKIREVCLSQISLLSDQIFKVPSATHLST
jgi:hypothetical protein